jgi:hypothetical protein
VYVFDALDIRAVARARSASAMFVNPDPSFLVAKARFILTFGRSRRAVGLAADRRNRVDITKETMDERRMMAWVQLAKVAGHPSYKNSLKDQY